MAGLIPTIIRLANKESIMFQLCAIAPNGTAYNAAANDLAVVELLVNNMRKAFPDYQITVTNNNIGRVHTFRAFEAFSAAPLIY